MRILQHYINTHHLEKEINLYWERIKYKRASLFHVGTILQEESFLYEESLFREGSFLHESNKKQKKN